MKLFRIIFTIIALGVILFNLFQISYTWPLNNHDATGYITILAALCGILLLQIHRLAVKVAQKTK